MVRRGVPLMAPVICASASGPEELPPKGPRQDRIRPAPLRGTGPVQPPSGQRGSGYQMN
jgi:hypothetical protein